MRGGAGFALTVSVVRHGAMICKGLKGMSCAAGNRMLVWPCLGMCGLVHTVVFEPSVARAC